MKMVPTCLVTAATLLVAFSTAHAASCPDQFNRFKNPFNKNSPHHRPMGTLATYAGSTNQNTIDWLRLPQPYAWTVNRDVDTVQSGSGAPCKQVTSGDGLPGTQLPVWLKIPSGFEPIPGYNDQLGLIYTPAGIGSCNGAASDGKLHEFYHLRLSGGAYLAGLHRPWNISGTGIDVDGVSATNISIMHGLLRTHELATGVEIHHVLNVTLPRGMSGHCENVLSKGFVWPADNTDGDTAYPKNEGSIPYGALFAIPPVSKGGPNAADVVGTDDLGIRLFKALRDYGAYVTDGGPCAKMRGEQSMTDTQRAAASTQLGKIYRHMRRVTNNASGQLYSGGGTEMNSNCINCAFDAP